MARSTGVQLDLGKGDHDHSSTRGMTSDRHVVAIANRITPGTSECSSHRSERPPGSPTPAAPRLAVGGSSSKASVARHKHAQRRPLRHLASRWFPFRPGKSNNDLRRAQFVPNTARNCGHSRLFVVSFFICRQGNRLARASPVSSSSWSMRIRFLCCSTTARC
jgi:hypothetical protein